MLAVVFLVAACTQEKPDILAGAPPVPKGYANYLEVVTAYNKGDVKLIPTKPAVPDTVVARTGIEYANRSGESLKLDVFMPKDLKKPAPTLVFIHGGGWKSGNREDYLVYTIDFAKRGYVTASLDYRLSGVAAYPAAVQDCKTAIRWLRAHATEYNIDPERIGVIGGSAGGYLSMMLGYVHDPELEGDLYKEQSSKVQAVANFYGPCDLTVEMARKASEVTGFLKKTYEEAPELFKSSSPIFYITKDSPPTLIVHGTIDQTVPIAQSDALAAKLAELGVPYVYDKLEGWPHTLDAAAGVNERCQYVLAKFMEYYLK
ncbi:MAG: alpha/beta hydrolase [Candidatus Hydrogenedentes bacterium]|nr:alpha/beta hydrolase [Candidatus Hydrogenedentota bacterium]